MTYTQIHRKVFRFCNSLLKAFFDAGKCEKNDQLKQNFNYFLTLSSNNKST